MQLQKRLDFSPAVLKASTKDNGRFALLTIYILLGIAGACVLYTAVSAIRRYLRTLVCLSSNNLECFKTQDPLYARLKQHLLYAPLFARRHSVPLSLWRFDVGMLPSRLQALFFLGIIVMNVTLATHGIEWHEDETTLHFHFRNRLGSLAVANMIPLFLIAGRNSPLIWLTRMSFATYNIFHRWFGRIVIALAISHAVVEFHFMVGLSKKMKKDPVENFGSFLKEQAFLLWGFVVSTSNILVSALLIIKSCLAMLAILFTSVSAFRHAFYETFLHVHIALVALILAGLWTHLDGLESKVFVKVLIAIWVIERSVRLLTLVYRNLGRQSTNATIEALPGGTMRVTLRLTRPFRLTPGQYVYLTIPKIGLWTSHPFSVAWSQTEVRRFPLESTRVSSDVEKAVTILETPIIEEDHSSGKPKSISLLVRRRKGFTERLYQKVLCSRFGRLSLYAYAEGPYGSLHSYDSYSSVMLIAGGIGITAQMPHLRHLVLGAGKHTVAAKRVLFVWIIRSPEHLEWVRPWMTEILGYPGRREVLRIKIFVTRPRSAREIRSPSSTVQMFAGKPDVGMLVEKEAREQIGAMAVGVCGPGSLSDDVRDTTRKMQWRRNVDLVEEGFGW